MELSKPLLANSDLEGILALRGDSSSERAHALLGDRRMEVSSFLKVCQYQSMGATWRHR
jgi:hypothetical protein